MNTNFTIGKNAFFSSATPVCAAVSFPVGLPLNLVVMVCLVSGLVQAPTSLRTYCWYIALVSGWKAALKSGQIQECTDDPGQMVAETGFADWKCHKNDHSENFPRFLCD